MKLRYKLATAAATGAIFLSMVAPAVAGTSIVISNSTNGRDSKNSGVVDLTQVVVVTQTNTTEIKNEVDQEADTGDNEVKDNLGGDIDLSTGDVEQAISVLTQAGYNMAELDGCDGCDLDVELINEKNGRDSDNEALFASDDTTELFQVNDTKIKNELDQEADTGDNEVEDNIEADVSIETGDVTQDTEVSTETGANQAKIGDGSNGGTEFDLENSMNGRDTDNDVAARLTKVLVAVQTNSAEVKTESDQEADTGDNEAEDNLGDIEIETGDVDQGAEIATSLGENALAADECCEIEADMTNEKNGRDTKTMP